ncbi:MAG TPA: hypothetical protein VJN64_15275 [Terriglobales bacterium]|nr:hypothetical protein [Terriglobales bacterium]
MDPFARNMLRSTAAFAISLLVIFSVMTLTYVHIHPQCPDSVLVQSESPSRKFVATVVQRRCGEESPFVTQVNLRDASQDLSRGFVSGEVKTGIVFRVEQDAAGAGLSLSWTGPEELTVRCPRCEASFIQQRDERWGEVRIVYGSR